MTQKAGTSRSQPIGELVGENRLCQKCNYSLRGLRAGGVCPECGTGIPFPKRRVLGGDNLSDAPVRYLRRLSLGLAMASLGMMGLVLGLLYTRGTTEVTGPGLLAVGAAFWIAGVWIGGCKRPLQESTLGEPLLDHAQWLLGMRCAQLIWLLPVCFATMRWIIVNGTTTNGLDFATAALNVSSVLAFLATVPVLAFLNAMATWAGDESLAARLHTAGWGIGLCGVAGPGLFFGADWLGPVRLPATVFGAIFLVVLGMCLVVAVISVVQIASVSFLAISSNAAAEARDSRMAQKRARELEELTKRQIADAAEVVRTPKVTPPGSIASPGPSPEAPSEIRPTYRTGGIRIEDSGDGDEIYDLAPEEPG